MLPHQAESFSLYWKGAWVTIIIIIIIIIIYPLTARVVGAPQVYSQTVSSIFPYFPLPSGTWRIQACSFPDVVFPPLPLSALSSSPFHYALQDGFGQTWWTGDMTIPLQFVFLYDLRVLVRSSCGPIACWSLARTSSLVTCYYASHTKAMLPTRNAWVS